MLDNDSLWVLAKARADADPDAVLAVDEEDRTLSAGELVERAERVAAGFAQRGVEPGDVVSWQLPTWLESMVLVLALSRLGAVQNPLLPIYRDREVGFITSQARSRLLVHPGEWGGYDFGALAQRCAAEVEGMETLRVNRDLPTGDPSALAPFREARDAVRWYFYTSGTTSEPKGARHTDASVLAASTALTQRLEVTEADRSAMVFPFTHIGGVNWLGTCLQTGCRLIFVEAFVPDVMVEVLARNGVTIAGAGTVFHQTYLAASRARGWGPLFPDVRVFPGGGAPKPPQLHYDVKSELGGVGIVSGYGLTEAPILTMGSIHDTDEQLAHTEGQPTRGVELRLVTIDGELAGPGTEGEIRAKGPQVMQGYLDTALDDEAFDGDGFFRTGDLGSLDSDGMLTVTGRLKDIIIRKGENISAKEIEDLLFDHPAVADVAVVGVPDPERGERACAVVVPAAGAAPPDLAAIGAFCRERGLMAQKLPEQVEIVDSLPRNPTGKVLKYELRDRFG